MNDRHADMLKLSEAFEAGRMAGADRASDVSDCPFTSGDQTFREAWLNGWSVGRIGGTSAA